MLDHSKTKIDPTARIEDGAMIGEGASIGPYCIIGPDVVIGPGCRLSGHVHADHHRRQLMFGIFSTLQRAARSWSCASNGRTTGSDHGLDCRLGSSI
jgi:NDP-sugar pyrophosphorylase family protein